MVLDSSKERKEKGEPLISRQTHRNQVKWNERLSEVDYQLCIILKPVRESGEILQESMNHGQTRDRSYNGNRL
jgi:hypothetical protein